MKCNSCNRPLYTICGDCLNTDLQRVKTMAYNVSQNYDISNTQIEKDLKNITLRLNAIQLKYRCMVNQEMKRLKNTGG